MDREAQHLVAPVSDESRPVRCADVDYSEVGGHAVVCDWRTREVHELGATAAKVWGLLDGRTMRALVDHLSSIGPDAPDRMTVVECVRRLRALGVVEDRRLDEPGPAILPPSAVASLTLRASAAHAEDGATLGLPGLEEPLAPFGRQRVLGTTPDSRSGAEPRRYDLVTADASGHATGAQVRLAGIAARDLAEPMHDPVGVVRRAVRAVVDDADTTGLLDALCDLVETVPVTAMFDAGDD